MKLGMLTACLPGWSLDRIAEFAAGQVYEAGFDGTLSVEHEDPLWGDTDEKVLEGLRIAHRTLRPLVAQDPLPM